jgi:Secretion system C-terminal sorting domain
MKKLFLSTVLLLAINTAKAQCLSNTLLTGTTTGIQNVESPDSIKATNTISTTGNAIYHAGTVVLFQTSFVATSGSKLHAYIAGCNGIFNARQAQTVVISEDVKLIKDIVKVSPNPNNGIFKININEVSQGTIVATDLYGFTVYKSEFKDQNEFEMNLQDNPKGIYIVKVVSGDQTYTSKIIKN